MFYGNAGFLFVLLHSLCASLPLLAQCHVANGKCMAAHMYMLRRASLLLWLSLSKQTWQQIKRRGEVEDFFSKFSKILGRGGDARSSIDESSEADWK